MAVLSISRYGAPEDILIVRAGGKEIARLPIGAGAVEIECVCANASLDADCAFTVEGSVEGTVRAEGNVTCGGVRGDVQASGNVRCGSVGGDVVAGGNTSCGTVNGDVRCSGSLQCARVVGDAVSQGAVIGG